MLECPYIDHFKATPDLLLTPTEARISTMEWMFWRYNPQWMVDREVEWEQEIKRLAKLGAVMGICKQGDANLIKVR